MMRNLIMRSLTMRNTAAAILLIGVLGCATSTTAPRDSARTGARNVILFMGDGMGVSTVTAARIFEGQQRGEPGEENYLSFEHFDHVALVKTYNTDLQVPDSAGTMTAIVTGVKTRAGVLSVSPEVDRETCADEKHHRVTLLELAERAGFQTGIVSTARITHATPAALYAHAANRNWENDGELPKDAGANCRDIAHQFVAFAEGDGVDVTLGGGRQEFLPQTETDPEYTDQTGKRTDGRDLVREWQSAGNRHFVYDAAGFAALPPDGQVLGLFEPSHMQWEADRAADPGGEPSLAEMTKLAINRLQNDQGFLLMVEAGRIDHAHHAGNARRALVDTLAFADAVSAALAMTNPEETLILVTADHSHTLTIAGYPERGNPILGHVKIAGEPLLDADGNPYTTLGYINGPGAMPKVREMRDGLQPEALEYRQDAAYPLASETHAGEDVAAYAQGPGAEGVRGVMDQNELYNVLYDALFGRE